MKRTILYHRASALIAAIVFAVSALCIPALAAQPDQTIDTGQTGSITIRKYVEENALTPLSGVTFRYSKVADIVQAFEDGAVKISYALDEETAGFLGLDEAGIYDASVLDELLDGKTASQTEAFMSGRKAETAPATDAAGLTTVTGLPLGLYLVCEYSYPAAAVADAAHCAPFFISVPSTAQDENGVSYWDYDVEACPKNVLETIRSDKVILGEGSNETKELDASVGEDVKFLIRSDIPNAVGKLDTYRIVDQLSGGLDYVPDSAVVCGVSDDGQRTLLRDGVEFLFRQEGGLTWIFNEQAIVGRDGNSNSVKTVYSRNTNSEDEALEEVTPSEPCRVYTYALHIHKTGNDTKAGLPGATFVVEDEEGNALHVTELESGRYCLDAEGSGTLTSDANGDICLKGLGAGTYYLRETGTGSADYSLLTGRVEIRIESNENCYTASKTGTYAKADPELDYYTDSYPLYNPFLLPEGVLEGCFIHFGTADVQVRQEAELELYEAEALTWSSNFAMGERDCEDSGVVKLEVVNSRIVLPKTGGDGDFWAVVTGAYAVGVGVTLYVLTYVGRKNKNEKERA